MKKLLFLLLPLFAFGQGYWDDWHRNDLKNWKSSFSDFQGVKSQSNFSFSGYNIFSGGVIVTQNIFYVGATPRKQIISLRFNDTADLTSTRRLFQSIVNKVSNYSRIYRFSRESDRANGFVEGIRYEIDGYKYELAIFPSQNGYAVKRVGYDPLADKLTTRQISNANLYYETSGISELNPFDLKSYSEFFGNDLLVFHNAKVSSKLFGWLGDGYLSFKRLDSDVLGLANGMKNNCIEKISINPSRWNKSTDFERLWTIYHEIAHDIYNIEHNDPNAGFLMWSRIPSKISFIDFFKAKEKLLNYLATLEPDDFDCSNNEVDFKDNTVELKSKKEDFEYKIDVSEYKEKFKNEINKRYPFFFNDIELNEVVNSLVENIVTNKIVVREFKLITIILDELNDILEITSYPTPNFKFQYLFKTKNAIFINRK